MPHRPHHGDAYAVVPRNVGQKERASPSNDSKYAMTGTGDSRHPLAARLGTVIINPIFRNCTLASYSRWKLRQSNLVEDNHSRGMEEEDAVRTSDGQPRDRHDSVQGVRRPSVTDFSPISARWISAAKLLQLMAKPVMTRPTWSRSK